MNGCPSEETLLSLLNGRLAAVEVQLVSQHFSNCPTCQRRADELTERDIIHTAEQDLSKSTDSCRQRLAERVEDDSMAIDDAPTCPLASTEAGAPHPLVLGRYKLYEVLGTGGFGVVYRAEDTQLNRPVALKLPRSSTLSDPGRSRRFFHEARAAAGLHHPNIVALYDAGATDGHCYLASAFVPGQTLGQWSRQQPDLLAPEIAAQIVLALAGAVQHAHENGVLHRDIKPHNVLLDPTASFLELPFSPKLTDFGVAKLLDQNTDETATGIVIGTPRYMAPELANGLREQLGPACDIYSLGVVLYELLTGRGPFEGSSQAETLRRVLRDDPPRPSQLRAGLPRDLDAICWKCLEKNPSRRYGSAGELAEDLQRFLQKVPTRARPLSPVERVIRWVNRQPALAALIGVVVATTILVFSGLAIHSRRLDAMNSELAAALQAARRANAAAMSSRNQTEDLLYVADMRLAGKAWEENDVRDMSALLRRHEPSQGHRDRRGFEWHFLRRIAEITPRTLAKSDQAAYFLRLSPDGKQLAVVGKDGVARLRHSETGMLIGSLAAGQGELNGFDFSPDGSLIVTAGDNGTLRTWRDMKEPPLLTIAAHPGIVFQARFTADGKTLVSCGEDPAIHLWDSHTGQPVGSLKGHTKKVEAITLSSDGRLLASASRDGTSRIWDLSQQVEVQQVRGHAYPTTMNSVALSPDGKWFVTADNDKQVIVWDTATGRELATAMHLDAVLSVAVSPDGEWIGSGDAVGALYLWQTSFKSTDPTGPVSLRLMRRGYGHEGRVYSLVFSADGKHLISAGSDGAVHSWSVAEMATSHVTEIPVTLKQAEFGLADQVIFCDGENSLRTWKLGASIDTAVLLDQGPIRHFKVAPRGQHVAVISSANELIVRDLEQQHESRRWSLESDVAVKNLAFSHNGKLLAILVASPKNHVCVYDTATGEQTAKLELDDGSVGQMTFAPNRNELALHLNADLLIWTIESSSPRRIPSAHETSISSLAYHPSGKTLCSAGSDRLVHAWDVTNCKQVATFSGHRDTVGTIVVSRDGRTLVTASLDGSVKVWHMESAVELFDLHQRDGGFDKLVLSGDGRWLMAIPAQSGAGLLFNLAGAPSPHGL